MLGRFEPPPTRVHSTTTWQTLRLLQKIHVFSMRMKDVALKADEPVFIMFDYRDGWRMAAYDLWYPERVEDESVSIPAP